VLSDENVRSVFREEAGGFWEEMTPPAKLVDIIREAVSEAAATMPRVSGRYLRRHLHELEEGALFLAARSHTLTSLKARGGHACSAQPGFFCVSVS